jgi:hypothetical protein
MLISSCGAGVEEEGEDAEVDANEERNEVMLPARA